MSRTLTAWPCGNRVLDSLPLRERTAIAKHVTVLYLASSQIGQSPDAPSPWVDFPIDSVLSVVTTFESGETCEVGTIGNEGASGIEVAFGAEALRTTICQVPGYVARIPVNDFLWLVEHHRSFERVLERVVQAQRFFVEQQCACNAVHSVDQRCARWFMMLHQRVGRDTFELTHEFLSIMLGVRRASVSKAAEALQSAGMLEYHRGHVKILDRERLAAACCECHWETTKVFDASLRPLERDDPTARNDNA